jgi:hypothetical protein
MSCKELVLRVLRNHHTSRIHFSFPMVTGGTITVNRRTFARVADAIEHGTIAVRMDSTRGPDDAEYRDSPAHGSGVFLVSPAAHHSRIWEGVLVHESCHAGLDLAKATASYVDDEVAAFLASAMYWVSTGLPATRFHGEYEEFVRAEALRLLGNGGPVDMASLQVLRNRFSNDNYDEGALKNPDGTWATLTGNG